MTGHDRPSVTVICPTFNRSRAILDTIESVRAQSVSDWELLVVSDGCTDDTDHHVRRAAARDARVTLLRTSRHGHPAGPRNVGLAAARGPVIAYLDHDDRWLPTHLSAVLDRIDSGAALVATGARRCTATGTSVGSPTAADVLWHPELQLMAPLFEPSRVAHRRGVAERAGRWRDGAGLEDWDLWLRIADSGIGFRTVAEPTVTLTVDPTTRRHRTARRHILPLAEFTDAAQAAAARDALRDTSHHDDLRAACLADTREWMSRIAAEPAFVRPAGWHGDPVAETIRSLRASWQWPADDLVVSAARGRYVVGAMLWCADRGHAARIGDLTRRVHPRQLALIRAITGGRAPGERVARRSEPISRSSRLG